MSFDRIVKYLDLRRAAKDETLVTKPLSVHKARPIKKVQDTLTIPTHVLTYSEISGYYLPRLILQYNITVGYEFTFEFPQLALGSNYTSGCIMMIKWREGTTVTRYMLKVGGFVPIPSLFLTQLLQQFNLDQVYDGQRIPSNFVLELWLVTTNPILDEYGLQRAFPMKLSRLRNPAFPEDVGTFTDSAAPLGIADLGFNLPAAMPISQPNMVYLDN